MKTNKHAKVALGVSVLAAVAFSAIASAQYEISRSTIDGGGAMASVGGGFELSGTIGQPDAGTLAGGGFELNGGFWFPLTPTDCNEDGSVNLFDYAAFEACADGPAEDAAPGCGCFDVNRSGTIDLRDAAEVQLNFNGS